MPKDVPASLDEFGASLHQLFLELPEDDAITDTLDYLVGALFGLSRAHELGFRDRPGAHYWVYRPYLANYALEVPRNGSVHQLWTAGFYFNSAIQRIAAAFDRIPQMLGAKKKKRVKGKVVSTSAKERMGEINRVAFDTWESVYKEINAFKHNPKGRATGRTVTMSDAVESFEQILKLLNANKLKLVSRYK